MKKYILLALTLLFSLMSFGQFVKIDSTLPSTKTVTLYTELTKETEYTITDKTLKIKTTNEAVAILIFNKFVKNKLSVYSNVKKDRLGEYMQYTIILPLLEEDKLLKLFNK